MQAHRLPAVRGAAWLLDGFRLFRRNPPLITALTLVYLLIVQLLVVLLPGIGPLLLPLLLPALTLIVANGCRIAAGSQRPGQAGLLLGVRDNLPALLQLGGLQLVGALLVVLASMLLNGGHDPFAVPLVLPEVTGGGMDNVAPEVLPPIEPAVQAAFLGALFKVLLLATPIILAFWFAPFLVGWDRVGPVKALFFSTVASLRNWRALAIFALVSIAVAGILPGLLLIVIGQISAAALNVVMIVLRMLVVFLVAPVLTASVYVSYRDIFHG